MLTAAQPAKLYILIGTNALVQPGNDDSFLAYYGKMLDELRTALPNTAFYVQSVRPLRRRRSAIRCPALRPTGWRSSTRPSSSFVPSAAAITLT